jgi:hypothetical protein
VTPTCDVAAGSDAAGRVCPVDYRYSPSVFDRAPEILSDVLYVVGGLYGNLHAFEAIERLAATESQAPTIVFNGDFHWFDAEPGWFAAIERAVVRHPLLRGNVETEIARAKDIGAGCGCAYPEDVDDGLVRRSNEILQELRAMPTAAVREQLKHLPMHLVAGVGNLRIGIVHGDAASLAGWRFAHDALDRPSARTWLNEVRRASRIDLFASTHTCLAVLRDFNLPAGRLTIVNNGAAGMPNFQASTFGLITRIATRRSPHRTLYGLHRDGVWIDAIPVHYDAADFRARFLGRWPPGSPAHASYVRRLDEGPDYPMANAVG